MRLRNSVFIGLTWFASAASAGPEDPGVGGKWAEPIAWPGVAVSAATLPDGRILSWASNEPTRTESPGPVRTYAAVWDPYTGQFIEIQNPAHEMFCAHSAMLEDGSVFVNGGRHGSPGTSTFDFRASQWVRREDMHRARYYPTTVALPNGTVYTALGSGGGNTGELWDGASTWNLLSGANLDEPILRQVGFLERNWFPHLHVAPDGRIFHSGPTPRMHMIDTSGVGSINPVGPLLAGWYPKDGVSVVYEKGKILTAGGYVAGDESAGSARAMMIDFNGAAPVVTYIGNMNFARIYANGVTLPNGEVAIFGGKSSPERKSDVNAVFAVELWNPTTRAFRVGASMTVPRNYHSVALLMVDGRVWSAGGGLCGCDVDHLDAQIWSPPYLFNSDGTLAARPELYSAPGVVAVGSTITVRGSPGLTKFSLVKMSSVTHSINTDMRFLAAPFAEVTSGRYAVDLDSNPNVLTPGFWMLFGVNAQGVPSVAKVLQVSTRGLSSGPPVLQDIDRLSHSKDAPIDMTLLVSEPDGDPLTFTATGLPPGVTFDARSGRLAGAPRESGMYSVTLNVADAQGSDSTRFTWGIDVAPIAYQYYTGAFSVLPDFDALTPVKSGLVRNFTLEPRTQETGYAFRYRGLIDITTSGTHRFFTSSDDGSRLFIDGALVVDNDGAHPVRERRGEVTLAAGMHAIEVTFFHQKGGGELAVSYQGPGMPTKQPIPDVVLASLDRAPVVTSPGNQASAVHQDVRLAISANDPSGNTLSFSATGLPAGLGIDASTGVISGSPSRAAVRTVRVTAAAGTLNATATFTWTVSVGNVAPTVTPIADRTGLVGDVVSFPISASDSNGDALRYSATNLPQGLSIDPITGVVGGTLGSAGSFAVTVTARDASTQSSASFNWSVNNPVADITIQPIVSPPHAADVPLALSVSASGAAVLRYRWSYGDGSPLENFTASPNRSHTYSAPGRYIVTVTVRDGLGTERSSTFTQAIFATHTAEAPAQDSTIIVEDVTGSQRVWNVNPDAGTVTVINATTLTKIAEVTVGAKPSSLALGGDDWVWVTNKRSDTISRIDPNSFAVAPPINLPSGSQPHGLVVDPVSGDVLVVLEALGRVLRIDDTSRAVIGHADVGPNVRHLSVSSDRDRIYVARFITPPLPGEDTAAPSLLRNGVPAGGEVVVLDGTNLVTVATVVLRHSNAPTSEHSGPGLPNYLRAPTIAPDGLSAWVPSKQDNILRGTLRSGEPLDHDHTVRAIASRIDLATLTADPVDGRVDFDDASISSAVAFDRTGSYLFVALEGNRKVAAVDAYRREELFRFDVGRAPDGIVMDAAGKRVFVHNFMDRKVTVHDLSALIDTGANRETRLATIATVASETLPAQVLLGKRHFYDALDARLAEDAYMSCASCHNDGGQDGRTWDFTGFGEGLRNTIKLDGQGGTANGPLHWTGNFDEIQDFEGQIREFAGGLGLLSDASFHAGTRELPLGDRKAGISPDLDALAAYLSSLSTVPKSPYREGSGALTASAELGKAVFLEKACGSCHSGEGFTDSAIDVRHDIGTTIQPTSGKRLGGALDGFDTPTLRGLWRTGPYLHDGSAATVGDAIDAHDGIALSATERSDLVDYLLQIDASEPSAVGSTGPKVEALIVTGVGSASWTPVRLSSRYASLVTACSIHQINNGVPQVVRMRNVASDRFEIRLQNPSGDTLAGENVHCLSAEEGTWRLSDGRRFKARKYESTRVDRVGRWLGEWQDSARFTKPVVLGQVMSYNDPRWSVFWSHGATAQEPVTYGELYTGHMVGEDRVTTRASETIGYMIFEAGSGIADGIRYETNVGEQTIRGWDNSTTGNAYYLTRSFPGPRVAVVAQTGMADANGSFVSIRGAAGLTPTVLWLVADEDTTKDTERNHGPERAGYFVIDQPAVLDLTPAR